METADILVESSSSDGGPPSEQRRREESDDPIIEARKVFGEEENVEFDEKGWTVCVETAEVTITREKRPDKKTQRLVEMALLDTLRNIQLQRSDTFSVKVFM